MWKRLLVVVGFLLVAVAAAVAAGMAAKLKLGPIWIIVLTAGLGLVSTVFSGLVSDVWKEQLRGIGARKRVLRAQCLLDAKGTLPSVELLEDPVRLGVRPGSTAGQAPAPYVARDTDRQLDEGLRRGGLVVVQGPACSGKTRAAYEAMRRVVPDRVLIAPRGPAALAQILDAAFPVRGSVIWLDRVEEYLGPGGPDRYAVQRLTQANRNRVLTVATLDSRAAALSLQRADSRLTALLSAATVVRLPAAFTEPELRRARELAARHPPLAKALASAAEAGAGDRPLEHLLPAAIPATPVPGWSHTLPPKPPCLGREAYVADVVVAVCATSPRAVPVLGAPGIGKTTVIRTAVHDPRVVARFGSRRLFVRCDGANSADDIVGELAVRIGVALGPRLLDTVRDELARAAVLVVLDNVGHTWERDVRATEELLETLAGVAGLALIVSLRGGSVPLGLPWAEPVRLPRLDHPSARDLFLSVAGEQYRRDPHLNELVAGQDGVALAVKLLAFAAQGEPDLAGLWRRWAGHPPGGSAGERYDEMDVCLEISVHSPRMTPAALRLLSILGMLPDGVALSDLDALMPGLGDTAASSLRKVGLAFDDQGRLRTLRPIREYAARARPPSVTDEAAVVAHYGSVASRLGKLVGTGDGANASARLIAESANLEAALAAGLRAEDPAPSVRAICDLEEFMRFTGLGRSGLLSDAVDAAPTPLLEGECLYRLGDLALRQCRHQEALGFFERALPQFETAGDVRWQANCVKHLGDLAYELCEYDRAEGEFARAEALYQRQNDLLGEAHCVKCQGDVAFRRGRYPLAEETYRRALDGFDRLGHVLGRADCLRRLADVSLRTGALDAAETGYRAALELYETTAAVLGQANCLLGLALTALRGGGTEGVTDLVERAQLRYERMAYVRGEADCVAALGRLAVLLGDLPAAQEHYSCALGLYRTGTDLRGEAACHLALAGCVADATMVREHGAAALRAYERIGDEEGVNRARELVRQAKAQIT